MPIKVLHRASPFGSVLPKEFWERVRGSQTKTVYISCWARMLYIIALLAGEANRALATQTGKHRLGVKRRGVIRQPIRTRTPLRPSWPPYGRDQQVRQVKIPTMGRKETTWDSIFTKIA